MLIGLRSKIDGTPGRGEHTTGMEASQLAPKQQLKILIDFLRTGFMRRENPLSKNDTSLLIDFTAKTVDEFQLQLLGQFYAELITLKNSYIQKPRTKTQREHNKVVKDKIFHYLYRFADYIVFSKEPRWKKISSIYDQLRIDLYGAL